MAQSNWIDYARLRWTFWVVLIAGLALALAAAELVLIDRYSMPGLVGALGAWLGVSACAAYRWQRFRCPRCGHRFFRSKPPLLAILADCCVHCMQSKD